MEKLHCQHCGKDITEQANKFTAGRAGSSTLKKHGKEHFKAISRQANKIRWDAYRARKEQMNVPHQEPTGEPENISNENPAV